MKIGIDIDDVVGEFAKPFLDFYNVKYGKNIRYENVTSFNLWEVGVGQNREEAINLINEFYDSGDFDKIKLIEGAREGILSLSKFWEIYFITSRPLRFKEKTDRFIGINFSDINLKVIYLGDFYNDGGKSKSDICLENKIKLMIEDNLKYTKECSQKGIRVLLFNRSWNKCENRYEEGNGILRVDNWQDVLDNLGLIEQGIREGK